MIPNSFPRIAFAVLLLLAPSAHADRNGNGIINPPEHTPGDDTNPPARPNILFIMSDDHTTQAVGAYATLLKSLNPTPNIDKLSDGGMVFENAFVTNSICTPSRACIITGQYNHTSGVFDLDGRLGPGELRGCHL